VSVAELEYTDQLLESNPGNSKLSGHAQRALQKKACLRRGGSHYLSFVRKQDLLGKNEDRGVVGLEEL